MNFKGWKKFFYRNLKGMSSEDKKKCFDYYEEMYRDRVDSGMSEAEILSEFGDPIICAESICAEMNGKNDVNQPIGRVNTDNTTRGIMTWIGYISFGLFLVLPLGCTMLAFIVSFGGIAIGGAVCALAGIIYFLASPFLGMGAISSVVCNMGIGISVAGVGWLIALGFAYATFYTCKCSIILIKRIFGGANL